MKTLKRLFLLMMVAGLLFSCSDDDYTVIERNKTDPEIVTEPFEAIFTGDYEYIYFRGDSRMGDCDEQYTCRVGVKFKGTGTHMENFTGYFDFYGCGPCNEYGPTVSEMVAENGDILYVSCKGKVVEGRSFDHPEDVVSYWRDPFVILGGTGKFAGATGGGMTDDYNSRLDPNSHHHWRGNIRLVKRDGPPW